MKQEYNRRIRGLSFTELQEELIKLERKIQRLETKMTRTGSSTRTRNYPTNPAENFGNLKELKKNRARVMTELNFRLHRIEGRARR